MADDSKIEWTDATWNPIRGCSRVSAGCQRCYAERVAARFSGPGMPYEGLVRFSKTLDGPKPLGWNGTVRMVPEHLADPLRWRRPRRVFVNSMSDLFHESLTNEQIAAVFGVMAAAARHTFQVLTKRARRMREWFAWAGRLDLDKLQSVAYAAVPESNHAGRMAVARGRGRGWPLANVWLGVSVENQAAADERIPELLATPAAVRWISAEPLIGPVNLAASSTNARSLAEDIDWVVAGCESGPGARPCDVAWLRSLRDQCAAAGVAYFLKQAVAVYDDGDREDPREVGYPSGPPLPGIQCGPGSHRKAGGVIGLPDLDGVQHAAFPPTHRDELIRLARIGQDAKSKAVPRG